MGKQARGCLKRACLRKRQATAPLTSSASFAAPWPTEALRPPSSMHRRAIHSSFLSPSQMTKFIRNPLIQVRKIAVQSGSEFPHGHNSERNEEENDWQYLLPFEDWTHNSAKIFIPESSNRADGNFLDNYDVFDRATFTEKLNATIHALKGMEKSSLWIEVPMSRSALIEEMVNLDFKFHHAQGRISTLNLWLKDDMESLVPEFATHHIGVGALVINSRDEVLCVRELSRNAMPWKIPGGLADLGEHIDEADVREVLEETGIHTKFCNVVCFRHSHGMQHDRSDIYFVCRLDPIEEVDENGNPVIPEPVPQENEIAATTWLPYSEFKDLMTGKDGHPMISHVLNVNERGDVIERKLISSVIPGRKPFPIYSAPSAGRDDVEK